MYNTPYDQLAGEYYDLRHKTCRNFDDTTIAALRQLRIHVPSSGLILDAGAGRGRTNEFLSVEPKRVVQLDSSQRMLEIQPREESLIRILHDAQCLPFLDSQFCCVTAFLFDPFMGPKFFAEAFRVLSTGGIFIGTIPSYEWGTALRKQLQLDPSLAYFVTTAGTSVLVPSVLFPVDQLVKMLETTGFAVSRIQVQPHRLPLDANPVSKDIVLPASAIGCGVHDLDILYSIVATK